jgi:hypothetical protein
MPNFPEDISENIVAYYIQNIEHNECHWEHIKSGDLIMGNDKIEVKCINSTGPSSFGPKEEWKILYFIDVRGLFTDENKIKIYKINIPFEDDRFQTIKVNKKDTFKDQALQGRRPRISFKKIQEQIPENVDLVYHDTVDRLF